MEFKEVLESSTIISLINYEKQHKKARFFGRYSKYNKVIINFWLVRPDEENEKSRALQKSNVSNIIKYM